MAVFFVLLLVPIVMQHFTVSGYDTDYEKKNKKALASFFILYTVLAMLRHRNVGKDTRNYIHFFKTFSELDWSEVGGESLESGFSYFNKIISLISKEPQFFLAVVAVIVSIMIYLTYKRVCVDSSLSIVLFCTMPTFVMTFSGIRQMIAVGVGFIAYEFARNKKLVPFILVVALAITFHTSAFMLLFMYPLYHARITKKWLYAVIPALAVVFAYNRQIFSVLTLFMTRYTKYEGGETQTGAYAMLILFAAFTAFAFLIPDESLLDEETIGLRNFMLLSLMMQMFAPLHNLAMRMNYYYIIFIPLLLPKIIEFKNERWSQVAVIGRNVMVVFFLIYFFVSAYRGGALDVFPYHFFWENI